MPDLEPTYNIFDALDKCPNTSGVPSARDRVSIYTLQAVRGSFPFYQHRHYLYFSHSNPR